MTQTQQYIASAAIIIVCALLAAFLAYRERRRANRYGGYLILEAPETVLAQLVEEDWFPEGIEWTGFSDRRNG